MGVSSWVFVVFGPVVALEVIVLGEVVLDDVVVLEGAVADEAVGLGGVSSVSNSSMIVSMVLGTMSMVPLLTFREGT